MTTYAKGIVLPASGTRLALSTSSSSPIILKGLIVDPAQPFKFDFILDPGSRPLAGRVREGEDITTEAHKLIKYFLASLTIPEDDLWVNLSPYEKDRIIPQEFGTTEMGRDLLSQDYILKQLTASLIYPEEETGRAFWQEVYKQAMAKYGQTNVPVNTFNKVWIIPDETLVYENGSKVFIVHSHLKVMLEEDYWALQKNTVGNGLKPFPTNVNQIVRKIIVPILEKEVNEGAHFAQLRQIYQSFILAAWYKKKLKNSILARSFGDQKKINGMTVDKDEKEKIYKQYLESFKKGVFNYISTGSGSASGGKKEPDVGGQMLPRKYFAGGMRLDSAMLKTTSHANDLPVDSNGLFQVKGAYSNSAMPVQEEDSTVEYLDAARTIAFKGVTVNNDGGVTLRIAEDGQDKELILWVNEFNVLTYPEFKMSITNNGDSVASFVMEKNVRAYNFQRFEISKDDKLENQIKWILLILQIFLYKENVKKEIINLFIPTDILNNDALKASLMKVFNIDVSNNLSLDEDTRQMWIQSKMGMYLEEQVKLDKEKSLKIKINVALERQKQKVLQEQYQLEQRPIQSASDEIEILMRGFAAQTMQDRKNAASLLSTQPLAVLTRLINNMPMPVGIREAWEVFDVSKHPLQGGGFNSQIALRNAREAIIYTMGEWISMRQKFENDYIRGIITRRLKEESGKWIASHPNVTEDDLAHGTPEEKIILREHIFGGYGDLLNINASINHLSFFEHMRLYFLRLGQGGFRVDKLWIRESLFKICVPDLVNGLKQISIQKNQIPKNSAMAVVNANGGIDLNADMLHVQTLGHQQDWSLPESDSAQVISIEGLIPKIERIVPIKDLQGLLTQE